MLELSLPQPLQDREARLAGGRAAQAAGPPTGSAWCLEQVPGAEQAALISPEQFSSPTSNTNRILPCKAAALSPLEQPLAFQFGLKM